MPDNFIAIYDSPYTGLTVAAVGVEKPLRVMWTDNTHGLVSLSARQSAHWYSRYLHVPEVVDFRGEN